MIISREIEVSFEIRESEIKDNSSSRGESDVSYNLCVQHAMCQLCGYKGKLTNCGINLAISLYAYTYTYCTRNSYPIRSFELCCYIFIYSRTFNQSKKENAEGLVAATREIGLEVSADKTKYMVMGGQLTF